MPARNLNAWIRCGTRAARYRPVNCIDQAAPVGRLLHKSGRALLHRVDRHVDVAVRGKKDDRQRHAAPNHFVLQFEPRHIGHANVKDEAARTRRTVAREKCAGAFVSLALVALLTQHEGE